MNLRPAGLHRGTFDERIPLWDGSQFNIFVYSGSDPLNYFDSTGFKSGDYACKPEHSHGAENRSKASMDFDAGVTSKQELCKVLRWSFEMNECSCFIDEKSPPDCMTPAEKVNKKYQCSIDMTKFVYSKYGCF